MSRRLVRLSALIAAVAAAVAPAAEASTARCITHSVHQSMQMRVLTSELMVAALSCRAQPGLNLDAKFNAYARQFSQTIAAQGKTLEGHFRRVAPSNARGAYDKFNTEAANEAARRSISDPNFCGSSSPLFDQILKMSQQEILAFAMTLADAAPGTQKKARC